MTTNPIDPNTPLDDFHPSRFLKVADLLERWKVQKITVTISKITEEPTTPNPKDIDPETHKSRVVMQKVLYFRTKAGQEFPRGYLLSAKIDVESLKTATKATTAGELIGKKIKIQVGEHRSRAVLRIDPQAVTAEGDRIAREQLKPADEQPDQE